MAVYQKYNQDNKSSKWIFVQPLGVIITKLAKIFNLNTILASNCAFPYLVVLQSIELGWKVYLKYWGKEYKEIASI
jgi:hypothetical protein